MHRGIDPSHDIIHDVLRGGGITAPRVQNRQKFVGRVGVGRRIYGAVRRWLPNRQALRLLEPPIGGLGGLVAPNQLLSGHRFDIAEHVDLDQVCILTITGLRLGRLIAFRGWRLGSGRRLGLRVRVGLVCRSFAGESSGRIAVSGSGLPVSSSGLSGSGASASGASVYPCHAYRP